MASARVPRRPGALAMSVALVGVSMLSGCATPLACGSGEQAAVVESIYFGMNKPGGGVVSDAEWAAFVNDVVTPRFPHGLTVWSAAGQWRGANGTIERERAQVLRLVHSGDATSDSAAAEVARLYKQTFRQEAVLRVRHAGCMSL